MANDAKLEDAKKEIRSLLISYQKGTSLSEFKKEYRSFIGRRLPFQEFGFKDEYSFLRAMPDAVKIYPSPVPGDYHLMGVADEKIKHIQKMVVRQKASKQKTRYRAPREVSRAYSSAPSYASNYSSSRSYGKAYVIPPRFSKKSLPKGVDEYVIHLLKNYPSGVKLSQFLNLFCKHYNREFKFREWGFSTLEECLEVIPHINARNKNNDIIVHLVRGAYEMNHHDNYSPAEYEVDSKDIRNHHSKSGLQSNVVESPLITIAPDFSDIRNQHSKSRLQSNVVESSLNPNAPDFFDRDFGKKEKSSSLEKKASCTSSDFTFDKKEKIDTLTVNNSSASSDNFLINRMIQDSCSQGAVEENGYNIEEPYQPRNQTESSSLKSHDNTLKEDHLDDFPLIDFKTEPTTNHLLRENFNDTDSRYLFAFDSPLIKEPFGSLLIKEPEDPSGVSKIVKNNLIKMIDNYPQGIFAAQFPSCYEKVTGAPFDLHSLGFSHLYELIDAVPDILVRKPLKGSKKDWIIFSTKSAMHEATSESGLADGSALFIECIILNIRKILQANPEGIPLDKFIYHYSINCTEPLYIRDLGFDNLEDFLLYIASRVPLEIIDVGEEKVVQFVSFQGLIKPPVSPAQKPSDIAPLDARFTPYKLPPDFNYESYHPVYTSSIANPGLVYLQFVGEETSERLITLYDEMNVFYKGDMSDLYRMKPSDIKLNVVCVALWPDDKTWYRARIISIVSLDFVKVFYDDYGTSDEIPMHMLRYIRKDYMALPIQAIKSRLAYLKPPSKAGETSPSWDRRIGDRMLKLCHDIPLMAKVENICKDGDLAILLCDTNGDEDLYINDILIQEGLAELCGETDEEQQPPPPIAPPIPAENFQQMVADIVAKVMVASASNSDFTTQLQNLSLNPLLSQMPFGFNPQQSLPPMCQQYPNISPLINPNFNTNIPSFGNGLNLNASAPIQPPKYPPGLNIQIPEAASKTTDISQLGTLNPSPPWSSSPDDEEIFDDDDDEYFEQLCQKNIGAKKGCVKRVKTTDEYVFHVLLHDFQPYISSGDISILIWHAKNPSYLFHKLQAQEIELASMTLVESGNEEFFSQLERFKVKGIEKMGNVSSILLYPLSKANQILNLFGHPSATLRAKINAEIATFNPSSSHWQELPDGEIPEEVGGVRIVTDDDKMNRLCLYDLKTMREGIRCKRLKLVKRKETERANTDLDEEINKLNQLFNKVRERIIEIEQIITMSSDRKK